MSFCPQCGDLLPNRGFCSKCNVSGIERDGVFDDGRVDPSISDNYSLRNPSDNTSHANLRSTGDQYISSGLFSSSNVDPVLSEFAGDRNAPSSWVREQTDRCHFCKDPLTSSTTNIIFDGIHRVHMDCVRCSACGGGCVDASTQQLVYAKQGDRILCGSCAEANNRQTTTTTRSSSAPSSSAPADLCGICGNAMLSGPTITIRSQRFHQDCATCSSCNQPLVSSTARSEGGGLFQIRDGQALCLNCASYSSSSSPTPPGVRSVSDFADTPCAICGYGFQGGDRILKLAGDARVHAHCLVCHQCGEVIDVKDGGYAKKGEAYFHRRCA